MLKSNLTRLRNVESWAFKSLIAASLGNIKEGEALIKKTMMMDMANMKNSTVWHIYGMIYKKMNDYDGARRAYTNALKYANENENILRDLSMLQIHTRDYAGFEDSRFKIVQLKPGLL